MSTPVILKSSDHGPLKQLGFGGALEGAESLERETIRWQPSFRSPDEIINTAKPMADARGRDMVQNDGYVAGAANLHKDNIVGAQYRLNSKPNWRVLGVSEEWAEEFQIIAESRFNLIADSEECYLDASRRNTFTGMVRLALGSWVMTGEVLATAEWEKEDPLRPFKTAIQMISPDRLSNPEGQADTRELRRGIERNLNGRPIAYHIRAAYPTEIYDDKSYKWKRVPAALKWGRRQVIHVYEQQLPDQSRGISDMVSVLKQMRMTKKFQEIVLQNAVVNATYAAAIESELPGVDVFATLGGGQAPIDALNGYLAGYMKSLGAYLEGSKNIAIDGAKIPHLFPGTKLNMKPMGTPGGVGTDFEQSLLRHIAAALGLSYEQFARDYTKTNYSSARASMNETWKAMQAKKRFVADRFATMVYTLWVEEELNAGRLPLPPGKDISWFYEPLVKDALCACSWIGASRGQIDELKETQAALARIEGGLSTYEMESARLGIDFRELFAQRARENAIMQKLGLTFSSETAKSANNDNGKAANDDDQRANAEDEEVAA